MKIEGTITHIIFRNAENGYSVFIVEKNGDDFTLVGSMLSLNLGEYIVANCDKVQNDKYGEQYKVINYESYLPRDKKNIVNFLASDEFNGIGEVLANRLVDTFGENIFDVVENKPDDLMLVKGMTKKRLDCIKNVLLLKKNEIDIILYLEEYDLTLTKIKRIIDKYGINTVDILTTNPYKLASEIEGISFITSDRIAKKNGLKDDSDVRIEAGIKFVLEASEFEGNVYLYKNELYEKTNILLKTTFDFDKYMMKLAINQVIKIIKLDSDKEERIYLFDNYNIEYNLTMLLYEHKDKINIITGGPGTGKTYNIKQYIKSANEEGKNIILCAPTGRAAKRMSEVTQCTARTIHRTLEFTRNEVKDGIEKIYFNKNENNKLSCDLLIVDEMSMVDMKLMYHLMKAVDKNTELLLVGDIDQLPSVGAGEVLKDMINSGWFQVKILTTIYRQDENSNIVLNSHEVNKGNIIDLKNDADDFKFVRRLSDQNIKKAVTDLVSDILPRHFNIDKKDVQVICPSKIKECGTENLNTILQNILNSKSRDKEEMTIGSRIFREGDKVMQIKNNYDLHWTVYGVDGMVKDEGDGVFNGDIGIIKEIDNFENVVTIEFDDREVIYTKSDMEDLSLGYAITVHKAQGSEYDVVVIPISFFPRPLLNRKILYTAMTRAKKCIVFIGYEEVFNTMIKNEYENKRYSSLCNQFYIS